MKLTYKQNEYIANVAHWAQPIFAANNWTWGYNPDAVPTEAQMAFSLASLAESALEEDTTISSGRFVCIASEIAPFEIGFDIALEIPGDIK